MDRRERALRVPKDSSVTGAVRAALGTGVRSTGTPITDRTIIDATPLHARKDPPEPAPEPGGGAIISHAIRAASGTPVQKARKPKAARAQGAQGGAAAGGPTDEDDEGRPKPKRRPTRKRSELPVPVAKGIRRMADRDPRFKWAAALPSATRA